MRTALNIIFLCREASSEDLEELSSDGYEENFVSINRDYCSCEERKDESVHCSVWGVGEKMK
jgi:hypothetical protein